jgi:hypothetical protein
MMVVTVTASSYTGSKDWWVDKYYTGRGLQAGCGHVRVEGPHETIKTSGELVYGLKFEPGTSNLPKKSETLSLEPACSRFERHEGEAKSLENKKQSSVC